MKIDIQCFIFELPHPPSIHPLSQLLIIPKTEPFSIIFILFTQKTKELEKMDKAFIEHEYSRVTQWIGIYILKQEK